MLKHALLFAALLTLASCQREERKKHHEDPFAVLDRHISHTLSHHYLWPWSQLFRAAAALDVEDNLEEPLIRSDDKQFEVNLKVKSFRPDELSVKVKNRYIIVEGRHRRTSGDMHFMANHFVQRFVLPAGSKQEEVSAVLKENGVLTITVPRHEVPPPPPEREVPIEVLLPLEDKSEKPVTKPEETTKDETKTSTTVANEEVTTSKPVVSEETDKTTENKPASIPTSSATPLEQLDLIEATTHVGKIRKKELKDTNKTTKDNEVSKGSIDGNGLDYLLMESE